MTKLIIAFHNFANAPKTYVNKISFLLFVVQMKFLMGSRKFRCSGFKGLNKVCSGNLQLIIVHTGHLALRITLLVPENHVI